MQCPVIFTYLSSPCALQAFFIQPNIPNKLIRIIKTCLNENYRSVWVSKHLDMFAIKNGLEHGKALSPRLFIYALDYAIRWFW
jgi:hypothetical protein